MISNLRQIELLKAGHPTRLPKKAANKKTPAAVSACEQAKLDLARKYPKVLEISMLAKWLDKGLDSDPHSILTQLDFTQTEDRKVRLVLYLVGEVFKNLPADSQSGNLMQFLCNLMTAKLKIEDVKKQESIDVALGYLNLELNFMEKIRSWLYPKRLEIHQLFDQVSNEKKRFVTIALKFATQLFSGFKASN